MLEAAWLPGQPPTFRISHSSPSPNGISHRLLNPQSDHSCIWYSRPCPSSLSLPLRLKISPGYSSLLGGVSLGMDKLRVPPCAWTLLVSPPFVSVGADPQNHTGTIPELAFKAQCPHRSGLRGWNNQPRVSTHFFP